MCCTCLRSLNGAARKEMIISKLPWAVWWKSQDLTATQQAETFGTCTHLITMTSPYSSASVKLSETRSLTTWTIWTSQTLCAHLPTSNIWTTTAWKCSWSSRSNALIIFLCRLLLSFSIRLQSLTYRMLLCSPYRNRSCCRRLTQKPWMPTDNLLSLLKSQVWHQ